MAVTVLVGLFKLGLAFAGNAVRAAVPRAALLGSIGGAGLALIGLLPLTKVFADPIVGFVALGVILVTLLGRVRLPGNLPGVLVSVLLGVAVFYVLRALGFGSPLSSASVGAAREMRLSFPWPSLAFAGGLSLAWGYLPIALPFSLATVVGGVDNTESAAAAGDEYDTRAIVATEGLATIVAGLCGGVVESTPYIGHPAYKKMGAGVGYVVATGLFVGLGGMLGYLPFLIDWIPAAAVAPILLYIGIEVLSQAFTATPARHAPAVALAVLPSLAFLLAIEIGPLLPAGGLAGLSTLPTETAETIRVLQLLGNGFIVTALLWGAAAAALIDQRFRTSAAYLLSASVLCLFGVLHSAAPQATLFLPWKASATAGSTIPFHIAAAYLALAMTIVILPRLAPQGAAPEG
jgi:AGZA family xanthine/uracil permease-like MFS transporter